MSDMTDPIGPLPPRENQTSPDMRPTRRRQAAKRTLAVLPSLFTLGNCLCGFLAIFFASRPSDAQMLWQQSPLTAAAYFVFLGMLFDSLDGRLARLTDQTSNLGEQLDSMADMVCFGVAPAFLAVKLIDVQSPFLSQTNDAYFDRAALVVACIYVACAALRLARFNLETSANRAVDAHMSFVGLPSPGAAGTVASLVLLYQYFITHFGQQRWMTHTAGIGMVVIMLVVAMAMVSRLRYVHIANRFLRQRARIEYIAIIVAVILLAFVHLIGALATGFVLYAISPLAAWVFGKTRLRSATKDG